MNTKKVTVQLQKLLSKIFKEQNVIKEWPSNASAGDWLKFENNVYAPRPDLTIKPLNIEEGGRGVTKIDNAFDDKNDFFQLFDVRRDINNNPRCLIAIEIENSGKRKYMIGNIMNSSILGKVGLVVTFKNDFFLDANRVKKYLDGAYTHGKTGFNPSNVVVIDYYDLKKRLLDYINNRLTI